MKASQKITWARKKCGSKADWAGVGCGATSSSDTCVTEILEGEARMDRRDSQRNGKWQTPRHGSKKAGRWWRKAEFRWFLGQWRYSVWYYNEGYMSVWSESRSAVSDSLQPHGLYNPWDSPGWNTGVSSLSLLQGVFSTQGLNPGLPHCRRILSQLSHQGSPGILEWVAYPFSSGSSRPRNRTRVCCLAGRFFTNWATREALYLIIHVSKPQNCNSKSASSGKLWTLGGCDLSMKVHPW